MNKNDTKNENERNSRVVEIPDHPSIDMKITLNRRRVADNDLETVKKLFKESE